ncbi:MAG: hypothetical protein ACI9SJ_000280 [Flavobacteriaceae bacterium]|jgi:hypothetical protein|uniref:hypothetical protein n=1 Tax=Candidatus Marifrigoribacter sp. Uisw_064 TaxID=3230970 RepID=UPI003ADC5ABE
MKYAKILIILFFSSIITLYSCNEKAKEPKKVEETPKTIESTTPEASKSNGEVYHYTCNKGCAGGAAAAGNCGTCGNTLAHNQAFHNKTNSTPNNTPFNTQPSDPGKNTAGIWHYTCAKGCADGAVAAGNCGACGNTLAHNQAYHQ